MVNHGLRIEDIAWQAFQAGAHCEGLAHDDGAMDYAKSKFLQWWKAREERGCELPACDKCGHDPRSVKRDDQ